MLRGVSKDVLEIVLSEYIRRCGRGCIRAYIRVYWSGEWFSSRIVLVVKVA